MTLQLETQEKKGGGPDRRGPGEDETEPTTTTVGEIYSVYVLHEMEITKNEKKTCFDNVDLNVEFLYFSIETDRKL